MSVNASLISSNDGASFTTKKEFELLKQNYKEKIAAFEKNIDNRIDNAINSYLDNMKIADTVSLTPFVLVGVRGSTNVVKSASPSYVKKDKQM